MSILFLILVSTFLISLIAFAGSLTLFLKEKLLEKLLLILVAFSAGTMLGGAFLHLIPEALVGVQDEGAILNIFLYVLLGFSVFFVLENVIRWHHHSREHPQVMPVSYLVLISDAFHNFIDGLIIAASFIVAVPLGIVTALVVAFHEIPQEIGDFGVLVYGGVKKIRALFLNFAAAATVILGGIVGFLLSASIEDFVVFLLPFAAGHFIYISVSDLLPEIKYKVSPQKSLAYFLVFLTGIGFMIVIKLVT